MNSPTKGDWVSEVKEWILEYEIATSLEEVKKIKKNMFENIVVERVQVEAYQYLKNQIKSKGATNKYSGKLEMQNYLKPNRVLTYPDQIEIFSYRSEMNEMNYNSKGLKDDEICVCTNILNNPHLYHCQILNNGESPKEKYEYILNGTLHHKKIFFNIMKRNLEKYRTITLAARDEI